MTNINPSSNNANTQSTKSNSNIANQLSDLIQRHHEWDNGSRKASKQELYSVLAGCLGLLEIVKATAKFSELETALKARNIVYNAKTSLATRIVRCVFNTDEARLSAFASVISIATRNLVKSDEFVAWINKEGGIDKTRRTFAKRKKIVLSPSELNDLAKNHLKTAPALAVIAKDNLKNIKGDINTGLLLNISRINANGDCEIIATTTDSTALRNALASWGQYVADNNIQTGQDQDIRARMNSMRTALSAA